MMSVTTVIETGILPSGSLPSGHNNRLSATIFPPGFVMKLRAEAPDMCKSTTSQGSMRSSMWSSLFSESSVPSDVAFYRRASWLEEYAQQRARVLDDRSMERRRIRAENRPRLISYLLQLLPCTRPKQKQQANVLECGSSRASLESMLKVG
ncbi:unnamed protein product [Bursaphelenchus okinawaensis]|uniref:Uncharacterized protein n=1 Tax=Bursaphelenchus okinawaensis TaxID=465554 RepID=A0A811K9J3_9BILA|nr:unnamed protein product [Bursaphelenchus okinawaensis]CAG9094900.1 unnamed protein product [Bursaphelenchus okinawaensis]